MPAEPPMTGAESLLRTAAAAGVDLCLANPGTSEMPLVAALDRVPQMRAVLALFEGVCTGAADGYGRMTDRPALTLLHHGPGFANGIANLHNAMRARSPVLNLVGDHPNRHLPFDAPLTSDIESLARPVSGWLRRSGSAKEFGPDLAEAVAAAGGCPGAVATLILPSDASADAADGPAAPLPARGALAPGTSRVDAVAEKLRAGEPGALLLGGSAAREEGLRAAACIADATGCRLFAETFPSRLERGAGRPAVERLPYFPEHVLQALSEVRWLILAGAAEPVAFFAYPNLPSRLVPDGCETLLLAEPRENAAAGLATLADALDAPAEGRVTDAAPPPRPEGALDPQTLGAALAAVQPEGAIVMEEAATSGGPWFPASFGARPHTYLGLTGGAIGQGFPVATGAALACPERPVIAFQADGGGAYTLQSFWTQAREGLDVTNVVCSNRAYRILQFELARAGVAEPGPKATSLTELSQPPLDWVALAQGFGLPGRRVERAEDLVRALEAALAEPGPHLIEAVL